MFINHLVSLIQKNVGKVLRLRKALYGLKQAPRAWNARTCTVYRKGVGDSQLLIGVYVDDLIICVPNVKKIT
jgi:hypothetical protein